MTSLPGPPLDDGRLWRWRHVLLCSVLGVAALVAGYLCWRPQGAVAANNVNDVVEATMAAVAAATSVRAGLVRRHPLVRAGWLAMAGGELAWLVGQAMTTAAEWQGGTVAFPGLPDVCFLMFPVGAMACLALLSGKRPGGRTGRDVLDAVIIIGALLLTAWATSLTQILGSAQETTLGTAVAVAYPLADVALASTALIRLSRGARRPGTLGLWAAGVGLLAVSDTAWTYLSTASVADSWQWTCAFWIAGFGVLAVSAIHSTGPATARSTTPTGLPARTGWQVTLPYASTGLALTAVAGHALVEGSLQARTILGLIGLVVLVLSRQLLALTEVRGLSRQLHHQAFHDPLTGLANRALFLDRLQHALSAPGRDRHPLSVLFLDLDGFKTINDSLGHPAGDQALVEVAGRLRARLDPRHSVARLGGDEFAVLLEDPAADPRQIAADLLTALRPPFALHGQLLHLRASLGLARVPAEDAPPDATEVLRRADVALYVAKGAGKDNVREYAPELLTSCRTDVLALASDLAEAIATGRLGVAFQPIVESATGRPVAVEALARWTHPLRGAVPPETFIPIAEQTGLVRPLTAAVLDAALRASADWRRHPHLADVPVSVNFYPFALGDPELLGELLAAVAAHQLPPSALIIEITESAPLTDLPGAVAAVTALRAAGFHVAIDDFGAGSTSMADLHRLPADFVKIDRGLLTHHALVANGLVATIISVTRALGRRVIVEGVETAEQAAALHALGADAQQGYHHGRPVQAPHLLASLVTDNPLAIGAALR
jgi:diguanylate cyclase